jgi:hypothetical protein
MSLPFVNFERPEMQTFRAGAFELRAALSFSSLRPEEPHPVWGP